MRNATIEIDNGIKKVQQMASVMTGSVRVSSIFSVGTNYIPGVLSEFYSKTANREIRIELTQRTTTQILDEIMHDELDIGFCGEFDNDKEFPSINREPLYDERIMLIVPEKHRLASRKEVSFNDIKDEIFIGYNNSTGIVNTVYDAVERRGFPNFRFKTILESNEDNNTTNLVKIGLGIAFVVDNPSLHTGGLKILDINDLHFFRTIYMVWKRDAFLSPAVKRFRETIMMYQSSRSENPETNSGI